MTTYFLARIYAYLLTESDNTWESYILLLPRCILNNDMHAMITVVFIHLWLSIAHGLVVEFSPSIVDQVKDTDSDGTAWGCATNNSDLCVHAWTKPNQLTNARKLFVLAVARIYSLIQCILGIWDKLRENIKDSCTIILFPSQMLSTTWLMVIGW